MLKKWAPFLSPDGESSLFKGIPIDRLVEFQQELGTPDNRLKVLLDRTSLYGKAVVRYRFRGPRAGGRSSHCLKTEATTFAVYAS
jgi:hypothetical protein